MLLAAFVRLHHVRPPGPRLAAQGGESHTRARPQDQQDERREAGGGPSGDAQEAGAHAHHRRKGDTRWKHGKQCAPKTKT